MLLVTCFTFFGLSAIQSITYFTNFFDGQEISLNIETQEEENENPSNEEVKEVKEKFDGKQRDMQIAYESNLMVLAGIHKASCTSAAFIEVATPPPEA